MEIIFEIPKLTAHMRNQNGKSISCTLLSRHMKILERTKIIFFNPLFVLLVQMRVDARKAFVLHNFCVCNQTKMQFLFLSRGFLANKQPEHKIAFFKAARIWSRKTDNDTMHREIMLKHFTPKWNFGVFEDIYRNIKTYFQWGIKAFKFLGEKAINFPIRKRNWKPMSIWAHMWNGIYYLMQTSTCTWANKKRLRGRMTSPDKRKEQTRSDFILLES